MGLDVYLFQKKELSYNKETRTRVVEEKCLWDCDTHELGEAVVYEFLEDRGVGLVSLEEMIDWCETQLKGDWEDGDIQSILQLKDTLENDVDVEADLELCESH